MSEVSTAATHADHHDAHSGPAKGLLRWVFTTNHKDIGTLYLLFALLMFFVGGAMAMIIRAELFEPGLQIVEPEFFNQMTTMHALIMVFGAVMPAWVRTAIPAHVQRGAGLVYVSPNRLQRGQRPTAEVAGEDAEFSRLFETDAPDELVDRVFDALPMDALPLDLETDPAAARGDSPAGNPW